MNIVYPGSRQHATSPLDPCRPVWSTMCPRPRSMVSDCTRTESSLAFQLSYLSSGWAVETLLLRCQYIAFQC
jgi:hypothetical protein